MSRLQLSRLAFWPAILTPPRTIILVLSTIAAMTVLPILRADYTAWLALGQGGLPHNFFGYFVQMCLNSLGIPAIERRETKEFASEKVRKGAGKWADAGFIEDLPARGIDGEGKVDENKSEWRPKIGRWILPQRQLNQRASEDIKKGIQSYFDLLAALSPTQLRISTSLFEHHERALFATAAGSTPIPTMISTARGEIVHMHSVDGSLHIALTPRDAALVVQKGWGERMGLAGKGFKLPSTLVLIYAPRDESELEVVKRIVSAGTRFGVGDIGEGRTET